MRRNCISVRRARAKDLVGLLALVDRCSPETLYRRFHTGIDGSANSSIRRELERVASPTSVHRSWVAVTSNDDTVTGVASLVWGQHTAIPETAFLVEDAWFRHGIGSALYGAVVAEARAQPGTDTVRATMHADNQRALSFAHAVAPHAQMTFVGGGKIEVVVPLSTTLDRDSRDNRPCHTCGAA